MTEHHANSFQLATLLLVLLGSTVYALRKKTKGKATQTTVDRGLTALSELRQWSTFLIAIQMGAISIMGFFFEKVQVIGRPMALDPCQMTAGVIATIFFGASILTATLLLGAMPSLIIRLTDDPSTHNDFFHWPLYQSLNRPKVGPMTGLQFILFCCGIVAFASFVYLRLAMV